MRLKQQKFMFNLKKRTGNKKAALKVSRNREAIRTTLESLKTKPKFTRMVSYSVECLRNMAVDEVSAEELLDEGVLDALENVLRLNPYNESIMTAVNQCLGNLAKTPALSERIGKRLGHKYFTDSLNKHYEVETLKHTCQTVTALSSSSTNVDTFVEGKMITTLKNVMEKKNCTTELAGNATAALAAIAIQKDYAARTMEDGAVASVLKHVKASPHTATLVYPAISLCTMVAMSDSGMKSRLKRMDAVDVLIAAMECHTDDEGLLNAGRTALKVLTGQEDIHTILRVPIEMNMAVANMISKVAALVLVKENVEYMAQNGLSWLYHVMQKANDSETSDVSLKILTSGCRAVKRMSHEPECGRLLVRKGFVGFLMAVMKDHITEEDIATGALESISAMLSPETAKKIDQVESIGHAKTLYNEFLESEKTQIAVLNFFQSLSMCGKGAINNLVEQGTLQLTSELLNSSGIYDASIAIKCVNFLKSISEKDTFACLSLGDSVSSVIECIKHHPDDTEFILSALQFLSVACKQPSNVAVMKKSGVADAVLIAMAKHQDHEAIQGSAAIVFGIVGGVQVQDIIARLEKIHQGITKNTDTVDVLKSLKLNLSILGSKVTSEKSTVLEEAKGVGLLMNIFRDAKALPSSENRDEILAKCVEIISHLATEESAQEELLKSKIPEEILAVAWEESENVPLVLSSILMMTQLAANLKNAPALLGTIDDLLHVGIAHCDDNLILNSVLQTLSSLIKNDEIKALVLNTDEDIGVSFIVDSISYNIGHSENLISSLKLLSSLIDNEDSAALFIECEAVSAIVQAARRHCDDPDIVEACLATLKHLEQSSKGIDISCVESLIKIVQNHIEVESLCQVAIQFLDTLSKNHDNVDLLGKTGQTGSVSFVESLEAKWGNSDIILESSKRYLALVRGPSDEELRAIAEAKRKEEEEKRLEEERKRQEEEEEKRRQEEEKRRKEEEERRAAEEKKRKEEEEARKKQEEERRKLEEEKRRQEEEKRRQEEEKRRAEEEKRLQELEEAEREKERQRVEEERKKRELEEKQRLEDEKKRLEEEEKARQEEEKKRQEEEERRQKEEEEKRKKEEIERKKKEEEEKKRREEERKKQAEARRIHALLFTHDNSDLDSARVQLIIETIPTASPTDCVLLLNNVADLCAISVENTQNWIDGKGLDLVTQMIKDLEGVDFETNESDKAIYLSCVNLLSVIVSMQPELMENDEEVYSRGRQLMVCALDDDIMIKAQGVIMGHLINASPETVQDLKYEKCELQTLFKLIVDADEPMVINNGARILAMMDLDEKSFGSDIIGNIGALISAMKKNIENASFLQCAAYLLGNFTVENADLRQEVGTQGGVEVLVQSITKHQTHESLVENCCYAFTCLLFENSDNLNRFVEENGIPIIFEATKSNIFSANVLDNTIGIILFFSDKSHQKTIVDHGGIEVLSDAILTHIDNFPLVKKCIRIVKLYAKSPANISTMIKGRCTQGLVAASNLHKDQEKLVLNIAITFSCLSKVEEQKVLQILVDEGAIEACVDMAMEHIDNRKMSLLTLTVLCRLVTGKVETNMRLKQIQMKVIVDIIRKHQFNPQLTQVGAWIFNLIAEEMSMAPMGVRVIKTDSDNGISYVSECMSYVTECLVEILSRFENKGGDVVINCLRTIQHFSWNEEAADIIQAQGVIKVIASLMDTFGLADDAVDRLLECYVTMSCLARSAKAAEKMVPLVTASLYLYLDSDPESIKNLQFAAQSMATMSHMTFPKSAREMFLKCRESIIRKVYEVIDSYDEKTEVQLDALKSFENLSNGSNRLKQYLKDEGMEDYCTKLMERSKDESVKNLCQRIITNLNTITQIVYRKMDATSLFEKEKKEYVDLTNDIRNFLLAGCLLTKWKHGVSMERHVSVSTDLTKLMWKDPKNASKGNNVPVFNLRSVVRGRATAQLRKKRLGQFIVAKELSFSVYFRGGTLDLVCQNHALREKWIRALSLLIAYTNQTKQK